MVVYSAEIADLICVGLESGRTLKDICGDAGMPSAATIKRWVREDINGFQKPFEIANASKYEAWEDDVIKIADDADNETLGESKLQVDVRLKIMGVKRADLYAPRRSGDALLIPGRVVDNGSDLPGIKEIARNVAALLKDGTMEIIKSKNIEDAEFEEVKEPEPEPEVKEFGPERKEFEGLSCG